MRVVLKPEDCAVACLVFCAIITVAVSWPMRNVSPGTSVTLTVFVPDKSANVCTGTVTLAWPAGKSSKPLS